MEVNTKKEAEEFVDTFFSRYPSITASDADKEKIVHDLLAFGLDCIYIGIQEAMKL